ncbi:MAG: hypothetical protein KDE03_00640 [Rhodobacteraceae bacterium]|nr:hypothetical protein [Paracoccaceae bacterium]
MKSILASVTCHLSAFLIALAGLAGPARCDLSANEAWAGLVGLLTDLTVQIQATQETGPDGAVLLKDLLLASPFSGGQISVGIEGVSLRPRADGTVELILPDASSLQVSYTPKGRDPLVFEPKLTFDDLSIVMSGTPDDLFATVAAGSVGILLDAFPKEFLAEPAQVSAAGTNVSATLRRTLSGQSELKVTWAAEGGTLDARLDSEWSPMRFAAATGKQSLDMALTWPAAGKLDTNVSSGFSARIVSEAKDLTYRLTQKYDLAAKEPGRMIFGYSAEAFSRGFDISKDGLKDVSRELGAEFSFELSWFRALLDFPFDWPSLIFVRAEKQVIETEYPTVPGGEGAPYAYSYELSGLTLADKTWRRIDPDNHLPRDEGHVRFRLNGLADPDDDFVAGLIAGPEYGFPGRFLTASVDAFGAEFLGLSLEAGGKGDVVYDEYGQATFVGTLDMKAAGPAGLIEKLRALGSFEPEDLAALLPLLETYAERSGPDTYTSVVDFRPGGTIAANGVALFGE